MYLKVKVKKKKHQKTIASDNFFLKVFYEWFFENWPGHSSSWYLTTGKIQVLCTMTPGLMQYLISQVLIPVTALWRHLLHVLDERSKTKEEIGPSAIQSGSQDLPSWGQLPAFHLHSRWALIWCCWLLSAWALYQTKEKNIWYLSVQNCFAGLKIHR